MTYRPELEGFITKQTLPFLLANIPIDSEGYRAAEVGEADNGAVIFECDGEQFTLLNRSMTIQKVPVVEQNANDAPEGPEAPEVRTDRHGAILPATEAEKKKAEKAEAKAEQEAARDEEVAGLLAVEFTSEAAFDLATEKGLKASDFTGKGSGKDGAFTVADVKERIKEDA